MSSTYIDCFKSHGTLIARILIGGLFLLAGIQKFMGIDGTAGYIASIGLPAPLLLAWGAALIETLAGLGIILGMKIRQSAVALALFTLLVAFIFHGPSKWGENPMEQVMFMKDLAILGSLLYIAAFGAGTGWKLDKEG